MYLCLFLYKDEHMHVPFLRSLHCGIVRGLSASHWNTEKKCLNSGIWSR